jgi:hypothetical protein
MTQPKPIRGLWTFKSSIAVQPVGQRPFRLNRIGGDAGRVGGAEPASGFPRGSSIEIVGQQTLVEASHLERFLASTEDEYVGLSHCRGGRS